MTFDFAADYADIFQVRGSKREATGELLRPIVEGDSVVLAYQGLDGRLRRTRLDFHPTPAQISQSSVRFQIALDPKEEAQYQSR